MNPLWFTAVALLIRSLNFVIHIEASPLCIKADENKTFCPGLEMEKALNLCGTFPSLSPWDEKLDRAEIKNNQGIIDICCKKDCTLRTLLNTFCGTIKNGYRLCERTNEINQDLDNGISKQTEATIEETDSEPTLKQHKQTNSEITSAAAMTRTAAEGRLNNEIFREPRVGSQHDRSVIIEEVPSYRRGEPYYSKYLEKLSKNIEFLD